MEYKNYVKNLWDKKYSKISDEKDKKQIEHAETEWEKWVKWIKDLDDKGNPKVDNNNRVYDLDYKKLDMKNAKYDPEHKPKKPGKNAKKEEKDAYREYKEKCSLANYINSLKREDCLGSFLVDEARFFCGGSVQYSCAFDIAVRYDVEKSFKNIIGDKNLKGKLDETRNKKNKNPDSFKDYWKDILGTDESKWLAFVPVTGGSGEKEQEINEDWIKYNTNIIDELKEALEKIKDEKTKNILSTLKNIKKEEAKKEDIINISNGYVILAKSRLNRLIDSTKINELEAIENDNFFSTGMRHKIMMLLSVFGTKGSKENQESNENQETNKIANSLLFKNKIEDKYLKCFLREGEKAPNKNWVTTSKFILDRLYEWTETENERNLHNTRKLGALAWNLTLNEFFADINNENYKQIIYTGAPGTGKTFGITEYVDSQCCLNPLDEKVKGELNKKGVKPEQSKFVQFHSSYDYSDFVEGLRPVQLKENENPTFVRMDGTFKKFCRNVVEYNKEYNEKYKEEIEAGKKKTAEKETDFYFIIDEINRADLGKVFGELMYGLEESYRGENHAFDTQYMNLPTYVESTEEDVKYKPIPKDVFEKGFYIPENVRIIGSMNDIDRSVETFDFALRRRFQWKNVPANDKDRLNNVLEGMFDQNEAPEAAYGKKEELVKRINEMNKVISGEISGADNDISGASFGLNDSYQIGGAYFKSFNGFFTIKEQSSEDPDCSGNSLEVIWNEKVEPALREYVRGRQKDAMDAFVQNCKDALLPDADKTDEKINNEQEKNEVENGAE